MKYVSYLLIMVMLIGVASLFVLKRPDGRTWLSLDDILGKAQTQAQQILDESKQQLDKAVDIVNSSDQPTPQQKPSKIYKWQDTQGNWHYSDRPNARGQSEEMTLDPSKITIMAAENTDILRQLKEQQDAGRIPKDLPANMSPTDIKKLVQDAQNIEKLMQERSKKLEEL
ncbi:DUF4124 domain-containing protein [Pseudoalteromonas sp. OOF1S-7]|uniref:DUF4124 domain-containing protein n=1 Tax=Pseudoalteromonas sp. OOF1S-7 TaxID=2917757 RepID=UPI001EF4843C|nr:DUF4124 domain-containing protein [Pseudoalteromonas sp. OOF1S-7]MCG7536977.1 DUF4124 domain-containing protein [Pseudoalteromonas sp. OOF1S-7]